MKILLLTWIALVLPTTLFAGEFKGILSSCTDFVLDRASISAICTAENGGEYRTALRLRGINNHDGKLKEDRDSSTKSEFHHSCEQTSIDDYAVLAGKCENDDGKYVWSTLDLTSILKNYNGTLVYPMD